MAFLVILSLQVLPLLIPLAPREASWCFGGGLELPEHVNWQGFHWLGELSQRHRDNPLVGLSGSTAKIMDRCRQN
jgi:hypothetical protein